MRKRVDDRYFRPRQSLRQEFSHPAYDRCDDRAGLLGDEGVARIQDHGDSDALAELVLQLVRGLARLEGIERRLKVEERR